jgi:hypothetical protein
MKRTSGLSITSILEDFLVLSGREGPARLIGPFYLPQPVDAKVDADRNLSWTWENPSKLHEPPSTLCFDFSKLADGSDENIRRFGARWGPLGLRPRVIEEPIRLWHGYARLARAILRFAAERLTGGLGREEDWNTICKSIPPRSLDRSGLSSERQTAVMGSAVNTWFDKARVHGIVQMVDDQLQVQPRAGFLFGILITQIAHAIARSDQMAVCSGCNDPFVPARPLSRGVRQYCKRCRKKKIPQRDAARAWRQRGREKLGNNPR